MKYIDEFRDPALARGLAAAIADAAAAGARDYRLMEFCGGHTHAIARYGIPDLLPPTVRMIHGPGCPVCVLPVGRIDGAIAIARTPGTILCSYGDTLRVPGSNGASLFRVKADGADVRMVYSVQDALAIAAAHPTREVVFFAIGFETTTPPTAHAVLEARRRGLTNFSVFCNHVLTPPAIRHMLDAPVPPGETAVRLDGFVGPAHVSTVIGSRPYEPVAARDGRPVVIAGFEPLDVMHAILMLIRQLNAGESRVEVQFSRAVTRDGNRKAQVLVETVMEVRRTFAWRGLGSVPDSALKLKSTYHEFDAETRFALADVEVANVRGCLCGPILRGVATPSDCRLFATACTPETPMGACMVSSEGACAAHYSYGRVRGRGLAA